MLDRSTAVSLGRRSYTTTATAVLGDRKALSALSALVDSAAPGSHAVASFFSAPVSLPANEKPAPTITNQVKRTRYFPRLPTIGVTQDHLFNKGMVNNGRKNVGFATRELPELSLVPPIAV